MRTVNFLFTLRLSFLGSKNPEFVLLAAFLLWFCTLENVYAEDLRIGKTSLKVSSGIILSQKNNVSVSADALIWNNGSWYFRNSKEVTLAVNTIMNGSGVYYMNGSAGCVITGDGGAISSLTIDCNNTVSVKNDFVLTGVLTLGTGAVKVAEGKSLKITNSDPDAIVFNNHHSNTSFIEGNLLRNTVSGNEYLYPVGTFSSGFHPFKINGLSSSGYLGVNYLPNYDNTWNSGEQSRVVLDETGGWQVVTDSKVITFNPNLSLFSVEGLLKNKYNLFYTADPYVASPEFTLNYNTVTSAGGDYLTTNATYPAGFFALSKVETLVEEGEEVPKMINFLAKNSNVRSTFEVPNLENYKTVILVVYDRFGNKIYESSNYANDFDSKDYRSGTYYYELILVTEEGREILSRNIIEITTNE